MKIAFRADSSHTIGVGHIMRCMNIAKAGDIFISKEYEGNISDYTNNHGIKTIFISEDLNEIEDAEAVLKILKEHNIESVFIDSYLLGNIFSNKLMKNGIKTIVMDDLGERIIEADYVVNHNPYSDKLMYAEKTNGEIVAGSEYTMIRNNFRITNPETVIRKTIENILITFGGSDPENVTEKVISKLSTYKFNINVVMGKANRHIEKIRVAYEGIKNIQILENVSDMRKYMEDSDFIICAGGTTLWEVLYLGVPFGVVQIADNQKYAADYIYKNNLGLYFGESKELDNIDIGNEILQYSFEKRVKNSIAGRRIFDGKGAERIREEIENGIERKI